MEFVEEAGNNMMFHCIPPNLRHFPASRSHKISVYKRNVTWLVATSNLWNPIYSCLYPVLSSPVALVDRTYVSLTSWTLAVTLRTISSIRNTKLAAV